MTEDLPDLTAEDLPDLAPAPVRLVLSEDQTAIYVAHCVTVDEIDWGLR